jgi:hypothetical protein
LFSPESLENLWGHLDGAIVSVLDGVGLRLCIWETTRGQKVMRRRNGFALALVMLLLVPCCKPDTPPPKAEETPADNKEAPAGEKKAPAERKSDVEPAAKEMADRFLKALKHIDSPEGRKTLAETRWRSIMKFPNYQDRNVLSEEMLSTDIPGVKGYKQVTALRIPREGGRPFVKKYMLIAYEDTKRQTWKVFDFTEVADAEGAAGRACEEKALAEGEATTPQGRLMRCSYWLVMAGKIQKAEEMAKKANELYARISDPDDEARYYKARADATLEMISRMSGGHT